MGIFNYFPYTYNNFEVAMNMITFEPLWETLKEKEITTLNQLCNILDCDITDIIKYTKDEK